MKRDMLPDLVEIDLAKERMKFSSGHFTIFSATSRENLHGHNFGVAVSFKARVGDNGMVVDYGVLKDVVMELCDSLDEVVLLPANSPYLKIETTADGVKAIFGNEVLQFLSRDVKVLPVRNITVEDLSAWFLSSILERLTHDIATLMCEISVRVSSGPGQGATIKWNDVQ